MFLRIERLSDLLGHLDLAFAVFVILVKFRHDAARRKDLFTAVLAVFFCHCRRLTASEILLKFVFREEACLIARKAAETAYSMSRTNSYFNLCPLSFDKHEGRLFHALSHAT